MKKNFGKKAALIAVIPILIIIAAIFALGISDGSARASTFESEFYIKSKDVEYDNSRYYNHIDGLTFRVPLSEIVYESFVKAEISVVPLKHDFDEIEVDGENKLTSDHEVKTKITVNKSDLKSYSSPSPRRRAYFEITANEWCAFVFTVFYDNGGIEPAEAYGSDILYCTALDTSAPTASINGNAQYVGDKIVFNIEVKGNQNGATLTADSGIKEFTVIKAEDGKEPVVYGEPVKNISGNIYNFTLTVGMEKASYFMDIVDNARNGSRVKILSFNNDSYDKGFEVAVRNKIESMEKDDAYAESLVKELKDAYMEYYLTIQETEDEAEIKNAMNKCRGLLGYIKELDDMRKEGEKEFSVRNFNTEYLGGDILPMNAGRAYGAQKYGDKVEYSFSTAKYEINSVDRSAETEFLGIKKAKELYTITVAVTNGGSDVKIEFDEALQIRLPKRTSDLKAVQTIKDDDGGVSRKECSVAYGEDFTVIYIPYSYGSVDIFVINGTNDALWALMAIPAAGIIAAATVLIIKKKKKNSSRVKKVDSEENK